jgi:hypothetical protein
VVLIAVGDRRPLAKVLIAVAALASVTHDLMTTTVHVIDHVAMEGYYYIDRKTPECYYIHDRSSQ